MRIHMTEGQSPKTSVSVRQRKIKDPLHVRAASVWGKGSLPTRRGVPRSEAVYEQDLSRATASIPSPRVSQRSRLDLSEQG